MRTHLKKKYTIQKKSRKTPFTSLGSDNNSEIEAIARSGVELLLIVPRRFIAAAEFRRTLVAGVAKAVEIALASCCGCGSYMNWFRL